MSNMKMAILKASGLPITGYRGQYAEGDDFGRSISQRGIKRTEYDFVSVDISNMNGVQDYVVVSKSYLEEVEEDSNKLSCLEAAGVDNWSGYDYACELMGEQE